MANCNGCGSQWDNGQTAPVGSFAANKFGLYDMVGNVWEWTEDCLHSNYDGAPTDGSAWMEPTAATAANRVFRGGSWCASPVDLRSAFRDWGSTDHRGSDSRLPGRPDASYPLNLCYFVSWGFMGFAPNFFQEEAMNDNVKRTGPAIEAHYQFLLWLVPTVDRFPKS